MPNEDKLKVKLAKATGGRGRAAMLTEVKKDRLPEGTAALKERRGRARAMWTWGQEPPNKGEVCAESSGEADRTRSEV